VPPAAAAGTTSSSFSSFIAASAAAAAQRLIQLPQLQLGKLTGNNNNIAADGGRFDDGALATGASGGGRYYDPTNSQHRLLSTRTANDVSDDGASDLDSVDALLEGGPGEEDDTKITGPEDSADVQEQEDQRLYRVHGGYHPTVPGEIFADRYQAVSKLGWGNYSVVWLAADTKASTAADRFVALKISRSDAAFAAAAEREFHLLARHRGNQTTATGDAADGAGGGFFGVTPSAASPHGAMSPAGGVGGGFSGAAAASATPRAPKSGRFLTAVSRSGGGDAVAQCLGMFTHRGPNGDHRVLILQLCGPTMLDLMRARDFAGFPLAAVRAIAYFVAKGLVHMHEHMGVAHVDLKPENVMIAGPSARVVREAMAFDEAERKKRREIGGGGNLTGRQLVFPTSGAGGPPPPPGVTPPRTPFSARRGSTMSTGADGAGGALSGAGCLPLPLSSPMSARGHPVGGTTTSAVKVPPTPPPVPLSVPTLQPHVGAAASTPNAGAGSYTGRTAFSATTDGNQSLLSADPAASPSRIPPPRYDRRALRIARQVFSGAVDAVMTNPSALKYFRVRIGDLGTSRVLAGPNATESARGSNSRRLLLLQTREYRAPEAILGIPDADVTGAMDVWSLGCMLFELLTGAFLFDPKFYDGMDPWPRPFDIDACHLALIEQCLGPLPPSIAAASQRAASAARGRAVRLPRDSIYQRTAHAAHRFGSDAERREFEAFLVFLLHPDPVKRPTAAQVVRHPWVAALFEQ
jgi:serine/threonine protein kinase